MRLKYNPFRPNQITPPNLFAGRSRELKTIEAALYQLRFGTAYHFLVEGERGLGKSSLMVYAEKMAKGEIEISTKERLRLLTAFVDLGGVETQQDIVRAMSRRLKDAVEAHAPTKSKALQFVDFLKRLEVLGVRYHVELDRDPEDVRDDLVARCKELLENFRDEIDGLFFIIDECDAPDVSAHLGEFVKMFTERLIYRGCKSVLLGLAGLPTAVGKLRASHESSVRMFEILRLEALSPEECRRAVRHCLKDAETTTGKSTEMDDAAIDLITDLSGGLPHFIQEFGRYAFEEDTDDRIDLDDVTRGAYRANGALDQLGQKYFDEMYNAQLASEQDRGVMRAILRAMAPFGSDWVSRDEIVKRAGVPEAIAERLLAILSEKMVIVADGSRSDYFKLGTKSFAAWIMVQAKSAILSPLSPAALGQSDEELRALVEECRQKKDSPKHGALDVPLRDDEIELIKAAAERYSCAPEVIIEALIEFLARTDPQVGE